MALEVHSKTYSHRAATKWLPLAVVAVERDYTNARETVGRCVCVTATARLWPETFSAKWGSVPVGLKRLTVATKRGHLTFAPRTTLTMLPTTRSEASTSSSPESSHVGQSETTTARSARRSSSLPTWIDTVNMCVFAFQFSIQPELGAKNAAKEEQEAFVDSIARFNHTKRTMVI